MEHKRSRHFLMDGSKVRKTELNPSEPVNESTIDAEIGAWEMGGRYFEQNALNQMDSLQAARLMLAQ